MNSYKVRPCLIGKCGWRGSTLTKAMMGLFGLLLSIPINVQSQSRLRPMEPADLFKLQQPGTSERPFSPRGDLIAYSLGSDIWVYSTEHGTSTKVTNGEKGHAGFWRPEWSPSGDKLLILSRNWTDDSVIHLWVWDRSTQQLKQLSDEIWDEGYEPYWISDTKFIARTWTQHHWTHEPWLAGGNPTLAPVREWKRWESGQGSYSILSTETAQNNEKGDAARAARLVLMDVSNGESRVLFEDEVLQAGSQYPAVSWSPSRKLFVSYSTKRLYDLGIQRKPGQGFLQGVNTIKLFTLNGPAESKGLAKIVSVAPGSVQWFPGQDRFVFLEVFDHKDGTKRRYHVYDPSSGQVSELDTKGVVPAAGADVRYVYPFFPMVYWDNKNHLVVYGSRESGPGQRFDWWVIRENGPFNLTGSLKEPPSGDLRAVTDRSSFVMLQGGKIVRIHLDGKIETVAADIRGKIVNTKYFPDRSASDNDGIRYVVIETDQAADSNIFRVDLQNGAVRAIARPDPSAEFRSYSPATDSAVFDATNRSGSYLWHTSIGSSVSKLVLEANSFLKNVAEGKAKGFTYTSLNGKELYGWLLLPADYEEGKKYPLVTWVYEGATFDARPELKFTTSINDSSSLNLQLWAAKGYAVLVPSMPTTGNSPFLDLMNGVLPAVQQLIASGVVDAERLAVAGHSNGGFSTVGLIAQTKIFKSAIAEAPITNWLGGYGQLRVPDRYAENADEYVAISLYHYERMMGNPPWKDAEAYVRNSPLVYADRIDTPLLLIHGDMDTACPMAESEQMYMALRGLGKKSRLIRYWGEGHQISKPANVEHMWQQMLLWLNETGVPPGGR